MKHNCITNRWRTLTNTQHIFNSLDTLASLIKPCECTHSVSQQTFSCRLNVLQNSESLKVWTTVMLNKCLNMFKSFTSMTTSCFFLLYFLVHFSSLLSLVTSNAGIALFRQLVLTPCDQSQPITVRPHSHCVGDSSESGQSGGNPFWPESPSCQSLSHSQSPGAAQETDWKGHFLLFFFYFKRFFGLIVSPDVPENEEVMWSVFLLFFLNLYLFW